MANSSLLNWIVWCPLIGSLGILLLPKKNEKLIRGWSLFNTIVTFLMTIVLWMRFDPTVSGMQPLFNVAIPWIESFHIFYRLGVDGISLPMIALTGLIFVICILSSWTVKQSIKGYFSLFLLLQFTVMGVFLSLDFFLFYVFWEIMLIPMFFLIGIWGGENREYAAVKFFIYTFFGSVLLLIGMVALYQAAGTFNITELMAGSNGGRFADKFIDIFGYSVSFSKLFFLFMFVGFAVKVPIFPFHTWLPHAHVQAPTAVSVVLAGILLKMGTYGFLRMAFPIFPESAAYFATAIAVLGLINAIYGALCAMAQKDLKRLVAYSSISHMGFLMMGMASLTVQGMNGAVLEMFNHGTSSAMMFLMVGIIYERAHHRWIERPDGTKGFGGLYTQMPIYSIVFIISMFASLGLPGLSGFISEALVFLGIYSKFTTLTLISLFGVLIGAAYLLWMFKRMFFGDVVESCKAYADMNMREIIYMVPLCLIVLYLGVWPSPILNIMKASVGKLVSTLAMYQ